MKKKESYKESKWLSFEKNNCNWQMISIQKDYLVLRNLSVMDVELPDYDKTVRFQFNIFKKVKKSNFIWFTPELKYKEFDIPFEYYHYLFDIPKPIDEFIDSHAINKPFVYFYAKYADTDEDLPLEDLLEIIFKIFTRTNWFYLSSEYEDELYPYLKLKKSIYSTCALAGIQAIKDFLFFLFLIEDILRHCYDKIKEILEKSNGDFSLEKITNYTHNMLHFMSNEDYELLETRFYENEKNPNSKFIDKKIFETQKSYIYKKQYDYFAPFLRYSLYRYLSNLFEKSNLNLKICPRCFMVFDNSNGSKRRVYCNDDYRKAAQNQRRYYRKK